MAEELGKVEKPSAEGFQGKRKLFFVPLLYCGQEAEKEYVEKFNKYWSQVESQISELEQKLVMVKRIFHELIPIGGEDGAKVIKELNEKSYLIVVSRLGTGAQLEATEESDALTEFMDWSKCLMIGLQNQKVFTKIYEFYTEAGKKRNEYIARQIAETLTPEESGILFMRV